MTMIINSHTFRMCLNLGATVLQGLKCVARGAAMAILSITANGFKGDFSTRALAIDGIAFLALGKQTAIDAKNAFNVPRSKDNFCEDMVKTGRFLRGDLQSPRYADMTPSEIFNKFFPKVEVVETAFGTTKVRKV